MVDKHVTRSNHEAVASKRVQDVVKFHAIAGRIMKSLPSCPRLLHQSGLTVYDTKQAIPSIAIPRPKAIKR